MKRVFCALLVLCLLLSGCSTLIPPRTTLPTEAPKPTAAETEETEEETEPETEPEPPAPVYQNPLNGEILDAPFDNRVFGISINNKVECLPHINVVNADMVFESFVNGSIIRCFALYSDVAKYEAIGSVRSIRWMFVDIADLFDAVVVHAGGDGDTQKDADARGLGQFNIDNWKVAEVASFRDKDRPRHGYDYEHTLFAIGQGLVDYSEQAGIRTKSDPERDYGLTFTEVGTPENGIDAPEFTVTITYNKYKKDTTMTYDADLGKYIWGQYNKTMVDGITEEPAAFTNVLVLEGEMYQSKVFQRIDWITGGTGWFANGGKAVKILWHAESEKGPLRITTEDGEPVDLGMGNTYCMVTQSGSKIIGLGENE